MHLLLKGLVDAPKEIARLEEKISKLSSQLKKLAAAMSREGYEKVSILRWPFLHEMNIGRGA